MLTNKQKYDYYVAAYERIERRWTKGHLGSPYGGACLVGAINYAVTGDERGARPGYWAEDFSTKHTDDSYASHEMQIDLATQIYAKKRFLLAPKPISIEQVNTQTGPDGGLYAVEQWNDNSSRTKEEVLAVIQKRIAYYKPLAEKEEVARLTALVEDLRSQLNTALARIAVLEARVEELERENTFLKKSRGKYTAEQLRNESESMKQLDDELNAVLEELKGYGVNV